MKNINKDKLKEERAGLVKQATAIQESVDWWESEMSGFDAFFDEVDEGKHSYLTEEQLDTKRQQYLTMTARANLEVKNIDKFQKNLYSLERKLNRFTYGD